MSRHATRSHASSNERGDWWSSVELPGGYVAPRIDTPIHTLAALRPPSLTNKTVLQVGGDRYFAFAAERQGAARVTVLDVPSLRRPGSTGGFEYAKQALASDVQEVEMEISHISPLNIGEFDVVLFLDTLHRLREPLPSLERIARVVRERLVVETASSPAWRPHALAALLREVGFARTLTIPAERHTSSERLRDLPDRLRRGIDVLAMTPIQARPAARKDLARSLLLAHRRLVVHGLRDRRG